MSFPHHISAAIFAIATLALAGCDQTVGADLDEGGFGNPTMNNHLVMTGQRSYVSDLADRFARDVPTTVTFAFNSAQLDGAAHSVLRQQAAFMNQFPEVRFSVYGHTDLVGSDQYNYQLGLRRARASVNYLVSHGVDRSRLEALVSLGETQPLISTSDREQRNRRAVTEVSGFVQSHPAVLDGQYARIAYRTYSSGSVTIAPSSNGGTTGGGE